MSHFEQFAGHAAYLTNAFLIRLPEGVSPLEANGDLTTDALDPSNASNFALLVHEYLHYLHNLSTLAGFAQFAAHRELVGALSHARVNEGWACRDPASVPDNVHQYIKGRIAFLRGVVGQTKVGYLPPRAIELRAHSIRLSEELGTFRPAVAEFSWLDSSGEEVGREEVQLGFCALEESIAAFVEEQVAIKLKASPPLPPPMIYPYNTLEAVGKLTAPSVGLEQVIRLALLSINTSEPWENLLSWLAQAEQSNMDPVAGPLENWRKKHAPYLEDVIEKSLTELRRLSARRGLVEEGISGVQGAVRALLRKRIVDPFFDLDAALSERWSDFFAASWPCELLEVLQAPDDKGSESRLYTFGEGELAETNGAAARRVLHAQSHFLHQHLAHGVLDSTASVELRPRHSRTTCPYFETCDLPAKKSQPQRCQTTPWRTATDEQLCWYGHAVVTVFDEIHDWSLVEPA